jgi:Ca2+-binding RTX toxin-like protein
MKYTLLILTAAATLILAPAALADTTVSIEDDGALFVRDTPSLFDRPMDVVVTRSGTTFKITDAAGKLHAKAPCVRSGAAAKCPAGAVTKARLQGGTKNDAISLETNLAATWYGDKGDDELNGGSDRDVFQSEPGDDIFDGRDGLDTVSYADSDAGVDISLAGGSSSGDGPADESDHIVNVENAIGSALDDSIRGDAGRNVLSGGDGADTLRGGGGDDALEGEAGGDDLGGELGDDLLVGGDGGDRLDGGADKDVVEGQGGDDTFVGDAGPDRYFGDGGHNTLDYSGRSDGVTVTLEPGAANDGGAADDHADDADHIQDLIGTSGPDNLTGAAGTNVIKGGPGDDEIHVKDGAPDTADCGPGQDGVQFDLGLDQTPGCEIILP